MYHFGYGSNLQIDFLKTLLPSAKFAMKGYLLNPSNPTDTSRNELPQRH